MYPTTTIKLKKIGNSSASTLMGEPKPFFSSLVG